MAFVLLRIATHSAWSVVGGTAVRFRVTADVVAGGERPREHLDRVRHSLEGLALIAEQPGLVIVVPVAIRLVLVHLGQPDADPPGADGQRAGVQGGPDQLAAVRRSTSTSGPRSTVVVPSSEIRVSLRRQRHRAHDHPFDVVGALRPAAARRSAARSRRR